MVAAMSHVVLPPLFQFSTLLKDASVIRRVAGRDAPGPMTSAHRRPASITLFEGLIATESNDPAWGLCHVVESSASISISGWPPYLGVPWRETLLSPYCAALPRVPLSSGPSQFREPSALERSRSTLNATCGAMLSVMSCMTTSA